MEPTQRKMKILEAVVEAYIRTGEPVGSKALCEGLGFSVSSATVRNDMAELASLGLLEQTHTSSGRIPTELGYRMYVDKLMKAEILPKSIQNSINDILYLSSDEPGHLLGSAAEVLSKMTGCAAVAAAPSGENAVIRHITFVRTGAYTMMTVLVTSFGTVKTKLFRCDYLVTKELAEKIGATINEKFAGLPVNGITPAFMQSTAASLGDVSMLMSGALVSVYDAAKEAAAAGVSIKGQSNLFLMPELASADGKKVLELLEHSGELSKLLDAKGANASIIIGSEINNPALSGLSVIVCSYSANENCSGTLALIGPVRMNYPKIVSALEYTASSVGGFLKQLIEGDVQTAESV